MVVGEIPRDILLNFMEKYQSEKRETATLADELMRQLTESQESEQDIRGWVDLMKRNMAVEEIDRSLLMRLIDKIVVGQKKKKTAQTTKTSRFFTTLSARWNSDWNSGGSVSEAKRA